MNTVCMGDTVYYLYVFIQAVGLAFDVSVSFDDHRQRYLVVMICLIDSSLWLQYRSRLESIYCRKIIKQFC